MGKTWVGLANLAWGAFGCFATSPSATDAGGLSTGSASSTASSSASSSGGDPSTGSGSSASATAGTVPVPPGCGDGVVGPTEICFVAGYALEGEPFRFGFLADLDNDGDDDLFYAHAPHEIRVRFNASGTFGLELRDSSDVVDPVDLGFLRFDEDDALDLMLTSDAELQAAAGTTAGDFITDQSEPVDLGRAFALQIAEMTGEHPHEAITLSTDGVRVWRVSVTSQLNELDDPLQKDLEDDRTGGDSDDGDVPAFSSGVLRVEDFNGDENNDVLVAGRLSDATSVLQLYVSNDNGTLTAPKDVAVALSDPADLVVGDFDGDAVSDFALADGSTLTAAYGDDALNFKPLPNSTPGAISALARADFDLDGIDDIAVSYHDRDVISVYLGSRTRELDGPVDVPLGFPAERIHTGNANDDSVADIIVTSSERQALTVLFSNN